MCLTKCPGIEIEPGKYSGCAGLPDCPVCHGEPLHVAQCCFMDAEPPIGIQCPKPAQFMVQFDFSPDGTTLACADHVGHMGASDAASSFWPLTLEEKTGWADRVEAAV